MMFLQGKRRKRSGIIAAFAIAAVILISSAPAAAQDCVFDYLSDIPLDVQEQAAPGIVMFLVDDSGSMDFAMMVEDKDTDPDPDQIKNFGFTGGMFLPLNRDWADPSNHGDGVAYVFDNPGDQNYSYRDLEGEEHLYWQSQYYGINKMYYNPHTDYEPWPQWDSITSDSPTWSDPDSNTSAHDMDPDTARSNPMSNYYTFDLNGDYYTFGDVQIDTQWVVNNADAIIDNSESGNSTGEIIIDDKDAGYTINTSEDWNLGYSSGECYDSDCPLTDFDGPAEVTWETAINNTNAEFEIYGMWSDLDQRGTAIPYYIHHSNGLTTRVEVNQEVNGGNWTKLTNDTFSFPSGMAKITIGIEEAYTVTETVNEVCADAIKLVCVNNCALGDPPFQSTGPESTASGWSTKTDGDVLDSSYNLSGECLYTDAEGDYTATWTASNLDPNTEYDVYTWWDDNYERSTSVTYTISDDASQVATTDKDQSASNSAEPQLLASGLTFNSGIGKVKLVHKVTSVNDGSGSDEAVADAVAFVPTPDTSSMPSSIKRAHYYVRNANGTFLVNMEGSSDTGAFHYYEVIDSDGDGRIDINGGLVELTETEAQNAGIVTGRTYKQERVNFANWYSFYRKRELTAKNAIANVVTDMQGVFIGYKSINGDLGQHALPVNVTHDGTEVDETNALLDTLYNDWHSSGGTPLRDGMDWVGKYFSGDKTASIYTIDGSPYTTSTYYPFFKPDDGGACEQAFTIAMTDGFWNGSYSGVGDADADDSGNEFDGGIYHGGATNTLADIAMHYYKNDLNGDLADLVPQNEQDKADHQHMVTYGVSFGADGTLDPDNYTCNESTSTCASGETGSCCPIWPDPGSDDNPRKIDDLYHASVNGRGDFLNAGNPEELSQAMESLKNDIESRIGSAAALATNTIQRRAGSKIYQGMYNTDGWTGDVVQKSIDPGSGAILSSADDPDRWSAAAQLDGTPYDERVIITYDGSSGIAFTSGNAGTIGLSSDMINYLRGDPSNNEANGGTYRVRGSKLGDIVHSAPTLYDGTVYIGANDGMLHAFDAGSGEELFAYVPKILLDKGTLPALASTDYSHQFYVDNTPHIRDTGSQTLLVGGLRKGGKGYFCLDVSAFSDPPAESDAAGVAQWEYSPAADDDLGYSYSEAYIVETEAEGWVVIFGNGYGSTNGEAVLYVLDAFNGTVLKKFHTQATGCNGLSNPAVVDTDADGLTDSVYAGDLQGNLWKFDLRGGSMSDWGFAYADGTTPKPLIHVQNAAGGQPITVQPDLIHMDCAPDQDGFLVVFGTGQHIGTTDFDDTSVQTFYGVWDWQASWPETEQAGKYLGDFTATASAPSLSNAPSSADSLTLLEQTATDSGSDWRTFSDNAISYFDAPDGDGDSLTDHAGWFFNLKDTRARVIRDPDIRAGTGEDVGIVTFISSVPSNSPCSAGGNSWLYQVSVCNGGQADQPQFDTNADEQVDASDDVTKSGKSFQEMLYTPSQLEDKLYIPDSKANINTEAIQFAGEGVVYWRKIQ